MKAKTHWAKISFSQDPHQTAAEGFAPHVMTIPLLPLDHFQETKYDMSFCNDH